MATTAERMRQALLIRDMKASELSEITGIGKSSLSQYLSGEFQPKQRALYKMSLALRVSVPWLMGLDVPMENAETKDLAMKNVEMPFEQIHTLIARNGKNLTRTEKNEIIKTLLEDD